MGRGLGYALELQRSNNGRYSDFPVAAVELLLAAADVFVRLCRVVLAEFLLRGTSTLEICLRALGTLRGSLG